MESSSMMDNISPGYQKSSLMEEFEGKSVSVFVVIFVNV